ncbi:MAG: GNAT family N-acetyltransferase [Pseudomonadota bacterium]
MLGNFVLGAAELNIESTYLRHGDAVPVIDALDISRPRSMGVLSATQVDWCRRNGIALAFDPMQGGWVSMECSDDLSPHAADSVDRGTYLKFRNWRRSDASAYASMLSAERLWDYLPETYVGPIDTATATALIELGDESYHSVSAVECEGVAVGQARLRFDKPGSAEISYWLGEEYWGKGYGSRLVFDFCQKAFIDHPEITRLFARVYKDHGASKRILEKAGFVHVESDGDWCVFERRRAG